MKPILSFVYLCGIVTVLTACSASSTDVIPSPVPSNAFTTAFSNLDPVSATALAEVLVLTSIKHSGQMGSVTYAPDTNRVLAVDIDDGYAMGWDVQTRKVAFEYDLGIVSSKALSFSNSGQLLMGATQNLFSPDRFDKSIEYVNRIALWDMSTGKLVECVTYPCRGTPSASIYGELGAVISPTGRWDITYSELTYSIDDRLGTTSGQLISIDNPDLSDYMWSIGALAFDEAHGRHAVVFQEGRVYLSDPNNSPFPYRTLAEGTKNELRNITTAKFDSAGNWLAFIRGDHLSVWQVGNRTQKPYLEADVPQAITLSFNRTGQLLFVAAGNQIKIWNLESQRIIGEREMAGIRSLDISEDNRLLVWGDANGSVHIWGVPAYVP